MRSFRRFAVWDKAHRLTLAVYAASATFPRDELFGLTSQIRRASMSIPTNIAEGCGRRTDTEFAQFLHVAMGSASEVEYQLLLARDLTYLPPEVYESLSMEVTEVKRMLTGLIQKLTADR
jgi:four helix bundle protein